MKIITSADSGSRRIGRVYSTATTERKYDLVVCADIIATTQCDCRRSSHLFQVLQHIGEYITMPNHKYYYDPV